MKFIKILRLVVLTCVCAALFSGELSLRHTHTAISATCTAPSVCTICFSSVKPPLGHTALDRSVNCTAPEYCLRCGEILALPVGHTYIYATCTKPKTCSTCGKFLGQPRDHTIVPASCTASAYCSECGQTFGEPLGHVILDATCTKSSSCSRCNEKFSLPLGHIIVPSTCTTPTTCSRCNRSFGKARGHDLIPATCTAPEACSRCSTTFAPAIDHSWISSVVQYPDCVTTGQRKYTCSVCDTTYYETIPATGHVFSYSGVYAQCTVCGYSRVQLNVQMLYQGSAYPNGCESVSTVMALRYMGVDISIDSFISNHLPMSEPPDFSQETPTADNPQHSFIGDPRSSFGYYCFAPAIETALNSLFSQSQYNNYTCTVYLNQSLEYLCGIYLDNGIPVILWSTLWMSPLSYADLSWQINGTDEIEMHRLIQNLHCVLLVGYDDNFYYINDPLRGPAAYNKNIVDASFASIGGQAVTISRGN